MMRRTRVHVPAGAPGVEAIVDAARGWHGAAGAQPTTRCWACGRPTMRLRAWTWGAPGVPRDPAAWALACAPCARWGPRARPLAPLAALARRVGAAEVGPDAAPITMRSAALLARVPTRRMRAALRREGAAVRIGGRWVTTNGVLVAVFVDVAGKIDPA